MQRDMERKRIDDIVRSDIGTFRDLDIPEPEQGKRWQRFDCPYCGKAGAAINYGLGIFWCPREECGKRLNEHGAADHAVIARFRPQINQAVRNIASKYGKWFSPTTQNRREAYSVAEDFILGYAGDKFGPNDAGMLDDWGATWQGDPEKLDQWVLAALNGDMANWAAAWIKRKRNEISLSDVDKNYSPDIERTSRPIGGLDSMDYDGVSLPRSAAWAVKEAEPAGDLAGYPLLAEQYERPDDVLSIVEMARIHQCTDKTMSKRLKAELAGYLLNHSATAERYQAELGDDLEAAA